jgi:PAS domain S-box-containing protein
MVDGDLSLQQLRARLEEAEETLRAIRGGEIDALIVDSPGGEKIYTLRSAEQPYRTLVEQMQEGAAILTAGGDILYCNEFFASLVGAPLASVIGGSIARFLPADDSGNVLPSLLAAREGRRKGHLKRADGQVREVLFSLTHAESDGVQRLNLIITDLTELLDARSGRDRAEQQNHAKDEFMAMLAHELRNPLAAIAASIEVLEMGAEQRSAARARAIIARQVRHLSRLVDDLLEVSRVITGKIVLAHSSLDLGDILRRCVSLVSQRAGDRQVLLEATPVWVRGDADRLEQVISNILGNAVKYTLPGGCIRVSLCEQDGNALLSVADDGLGIAPELLPRIFDPFVQGERTLDRSQGGLGVGLTLVHRLVHLHGGTVQAHSDGVGRGSRFTVTLPSIPAPEEETANAPLSMGRPCANRRRVLLIEDNQDARESFKLILQLQGHEVLEAEDGVSGLNMLLAERPDVALIDVGLPGLDGYQVAARFRASGQGAASKLVALTGYGTADARDRSRQSGFDHHLIKPVNPELLRELIEASPAPPAQRELSGSLR